ncbi:hypothetical protein ACVOMS_04995 [Bradyrhizobium guangxiense]
MADRLAQVSAQIENVRQLQSVVTAMRGIAASRVQRARALLAGGDAYSAVVSLAIGQALTLLPADYRAEHGSRRAAVVLFALNRVLPAPTASAFWIAGARTCRARRCSWSEAAAGWRPASAA